MLTRHVRWQLLCWIFEAEDIEPAIDYPNPCRPSHLRNSGTSHARQEAGDVPTGGTSKGAGPRDIHRALSREGGQETRSAQRKSFSDKELSDDSRSSLSEEDLSQRCADEERWLRQHSRLPSATVESSAVETGAEGPQNRVDGLTRVGALATVVGLPDARSPRHELSSSTGTLDDAGGRGETDSFGGERKGEGGRLRRSRGATAGADDWKQFLGPVANGQNY